MLEVDTPRGVAHVVVERPKRRPIALLVLGHGAGGGVDSADLQAVRRGALGADIAVALVTQPYRVLGRAAPPAAAALDEAWSVAVSAAREAAGPRLPLVVGGRSLGARVACRTAAALGAVGVLALAFPLHPPGRPDKTRAGELDADRPTLVVNGDADPFGVPAPIGRIRVEVRAGERHELRRDPDGVAEVAVAWLRDLLGVKSLKPANPA
jgi:uncharacterized protein